MPTRRLILHVNRISPRDRDSLADDAVSATTRFCSPAFTPIAAKFTACWPEPQKRLMVTPVESLGHSAASTDIRAIHIAWSP